MKRLSFPSLVGAHVLLSLFGGAAATEGAPPIRTSDESRRAGDSGNLQAEALRTELAGLARKAQAAVRGTAWTVRISGEVPDSGGKVSALVQVSFMSDGPLWRLSTEQERKVNEAVTILVERVNAGTDQVRSLRETPGEVTIERSISISTEAERIDLLDQSLRFLDPHLPATLWERLADFDVERETTDGMRMRWTLRPRDRPGQAYILVMDTAGEPRIVEFRHTVAGPDDPTKKVALTMELITTVELDALRQPARVVSRIFHKDKLAYTRTLSVTRSEKEEHVEAKVRSEVVPVDGTRVTDPDRRVQFVTGAAEIEVAGVSHRLRTPLREYRPELLEQILADRLVENTAASGAAPQ